jgi:hypothetical protein
MTCAFLAVFWLTWVRSLKSYQEGVGSQPCHRLVWNMHALTWYFRWRLLSQWDTSVTAPQVQDLLPTMHNFSLFLLQLSSCLRAKTRCSYYHAWWGWSEDKIFGCSARMLEWIRMYSLNTMWKQNRKYVDCVNAMIQHEHHHLEWVTSLSCRRYSNTQGRKTSCGLGAALRRIKCMAYGLVALL